MALKSTIFRATLNVSDLDRPHYGEHLLTIAKHPSETDERMMMRILAFALNADERLAFGRGLSSDDEPALWLKDDTGRIIKWIEVGLPDERLLRRASGRADAVFVLAYGGRAADIWWQKEGGAIARLPNLSVYSIPAAASRQLAELAERSMTLNFTIQDGQIWFSVGEETISVQPDCLFPI